MVPSSPSFTDSGSIQVWRFLSSRAWNKSPQPDFLWTLPQFEHSQCKEMGYADRLNLWYMALLELKGAGSFLPNNFKEVFPKKDSGHRCQKREEWSWESKNHSSLPHPWVIIWLSLEGESSSWNLGVTLAIRRWARSVLRHRDTGEHMWPLTQVRS